MYGLSYFVRDLLVSIWPVEAFKEMKKMTLKLRNRHCPGECYDRRRKRCY